MFDGIDLPYILLSYVALLFSLSVHEAAHAASAYWLGDDTAKRLGRLTLNPIAHMDILGTLIFPLAGMLTKMPFIGWAKPVPVDPRNFTRKVTMRQGMAITSAAGPASNLLLAIVFFALTILFSKLLEPAPGLANALLKISLRGQTEILLQAGISPAAVFPLALCGLMVLLNIMLAVFNMLPVGPLDGGGVLQGFLSYRAAATFEKYKPHMYIALIVLALTPILSIVLGPILGLIRFALESIGAFILGV